MASKASLNADLFEYSGRFTCIQEGLLKERIFFFETEYSYFAALSNRRHQRKNVHHRNSYA